MKRKIKVYLDTLVISALWEKVKKDFPKNPTLQEVHYAGLRIHKKTKGVS